MKNKPHTTSTLIRKNNNITTNQNNRFLDNNQRQGTGLWCHATTKEEKEDKLILPKANSNKIIKLDTDHEKLIAPRLKDQLSKLTQDFQSSLIKISELEYLNRKQEDQITNYKITVEQNITELKVDQEVMKNKFTKNIKYMTNIEETIKKEKKQREIIIKTKSTIVTINQTQGMKMRKKLILNTHTVIQQIQLIIHQN